MSEFGLSNKKLNGCLENEEIEENILNSRVDAQKKYKIDSTPTVIINQKKLKGPTSFENIESVIKKII